MVLLDSFDSVEDVDLNNHERPTPKAKALPEMAGGELAETGKVWETDSSLTATAFPDSNWLHF